MVSCKALKDDGVFLREVLGLVEFIMKEPRVVGMGGEDARKHVRYRALVEQGEGGTIREMGRALEWLEECEGVVGSEMGLCGFDVDIGSPFLPRLDL
jgi:hypothetical protein